MSPAKLDADVVVIGAGAAGIAAARTASEAGARVSLLALSSGALGLGGGVVWGASRDPFVRWATGPAWRLGGRYVTPGALLVTGVAGALTSLLDLEALPAGTTLGVVDLQTHPTWSARLVAETLGGVVLPCDWEAPGETFLEAAQALDTDGLAEGVALKLRGAVEASRVGAVLFPPVLGLRRDDVARRMSAALGRPVGETLGAAGDPTGSRMLRAIEAWLPANVRRHTGRATVETGRSPRVLLATGEQVRARAVVIATGGIAGGGLSFEDTLVETTAGLPVWTRTHERIPERSGAARGADSQAWFAEGTGRVRGAGVRVDDRGRVLASDGVSPVAPWLFAAGEVTVPRFGEGIAGALAAGARAGVEAARFAQG